MDRGSAALPGQDLAARLREIDGCGYKAYKCLQGGRFRFDGIELRFDHVQGDPFARASRVRVRVPAPRAGHDPDNPHDPDRRRALEDFLCRRLGAALNRHGGGQRGSGHSGEFAIARCGQQVLLRDAIRVDPGGVEARLGVALPARGRSIDGRLAARMLLEELPAAAAEALFADRIDLDRLRLHLNSVEDQVALRAWLGTAGLVAFVGNGARLARRSGVDDRPLVEGAVAFESPPSLAREVDLPHAGRIRGMGLGSGISLIVGGGFHGKSTLLKALQLGVYDHLPGDGRERVVCEPGACKIRAEDGRSIDRVDISAFVDLSALGRDTRVFSTANASGSTSQAANIVEALSGGCRTLLIDEDTTATNFMLRDERMRRLVGAEREPITPLVDQARELCDRHGVSIVLVTGGSGAYLDVADRVVMMDRYRPVDVSAAAAGLARAPLGAERDGGALDLAPTAARAWPAGRGPDPAAARIRVETMGTERLRVGECALDLARVEQLVDPGQLLAIGYLLLRLAAEPGTTAGLDGLSRLLEQSVADGLDGLSPFPGQPHGGLAAPRLAELYAAFNRMRA